MLHVKGTIVVFIINFCPFLLTEPITKFDARYDRKFVSSAFFWHELEEEVRERRRDWCFNGYDCENLDDAINAINDLRQGELYRHDEANCSTLCKEKGKFLNVHWYNAIPFFFLTW